MPRVRELQVTASAIADLIDAGQFATAEKALRAIGEASPLVRVLRAEVEIYFSRLREAERLLDEVAPEAKDVDVAARYAMARGELSYWLYRYEEAEEHFHIALHFYKFLGDPFHQAVAFYNLGRLERRRARFEEAERLLRHSGELLSKVRDDPRTEFLRGLVLFNLGAIRLHRGELESAESFFKEAAGILEAGESQRYYGLILNSLGGLYLYLGDYHKAITVLQMARRIFKELRSFHDLEHVSNNVALALIQLERYEEAESLLQESFELAQGVGNVTSASTFLTSFTELYVARGDLEKAQLYGTRASEYAELAGNLFEKGRALVQLGRVVLLKGRYYESEKALRQALEIGERLKSREVEVPACLYLAELMLAVQPMKAREWLARAERLLVEYPHAWFRAEFERIRRKMDEGRIRVEEERFIVDGTRLPRWYEAKEALEIFLIRRALEQSGGNLSRAGELLGTTRVHVHKKKKQYGL
jgi:tetratricopeptide (TPR) repeat protein